MDFKEEHTSEYSVVYLWLIITAGIAGWDTGVPLKQPWG